jgi:hypothetical protein
MHAECKRGRSRRCPSQVSVCESRSPRRRSMVLTPKEQRKYATPDVTLAYNRRGLLASRVDDGCGRHAGGHLRGKWRDRGGRVCGQRRPERVYAGPLRSHEGGTTWIMQKSCNQRAFRASRRETLGTTHAVCYAGCLYGTETSRKFTRFRTRRCSEPLRTSRRLLPASALPPPCSRRAVLRGR